MDRDRWHLDGLWLTFRPGAGSLELVQLRRDHALASRRERRTGLAAPLRQQLADIIRGRAPERFDAACVRARARSFLASSMAASRAEKSAPSTRPPVVGDV